MLKGHFERQRTVVLAKLDGRKTRERWTKSLQFKADDETLDDDDLEQTLDTRAGNVKLDADMLFATAVWKKQLSSDAYTFLLSMIEDYGAQAADDMGVTWLGIKDPVLAAQIQRSLDNLVLIEDTTHDAIQSAINEGEIAKVPADDLRNSVEDVFDAAVDTRAALIAGDVVHGTQQMSTVAAGRQAASQDQAAIASGAKPVGLGEGYTGPSKTWVTQGDERVRDWHEDADGQEVPVDQPFDVGGESLMFPGDPDGSPENVINCRCYVFVSRPGELGEQTDEADDGDSDPYDLIGASDAEDEPKSRGYQLGAWRRYKVKTFSYKAGPLWDTQPISRDDIVGKSMQGKYSQDQPRDPDGRFGDGDGSAAATEFPLLSFQEADKPSRQDGTPNLAAGAKWINEHATTNITDAQHAAIRLYTDSSEEVNQPLRDGEADEQSSSFWANTHLMDAAIEANHLDTNAVVFRGTSANMIKGRKVGDVFTDEGFVSTTLNRGIAVGFGDRTMAIHVPAGSPALGITKELSFATENEVLLPRDSRFRVDSLGGSGEEGNAGPGTGIRGPRNPPVVTYLGRVKK